jgi:hypothetical protein
VKKVHLGFGWYLMERPYLRAHADYLVSPEVDRVRGWVAMAIEHGRRWIGRIPYGPTRNPRER